MFVIFTIMGLFVERNLENTWYDIISTFVCGGVFLAWSLACYAEAYTINDLRRKRKQNAIQSPRQTINCILEFISGLIILIPAILIAIVFVEQYFI